MNQQDTKLFYLHAENLRHSVPCTLRTESKSHHEGHLMSPTIPFGTLECYK